MLKVIDKRVPLAVALVVVLTWKAWSTGKNFDCPALLLSNRSFKPAAWVLIENRDNPVINEVLIMAKASAQDFLEVRLFMATDFDTGILIDMIDYL